MDADTAPVPDEDAQDEGITTADWIADLDRYYRDERPAPRQAHEFSVNEWRDEMSKRRGIELHRNQAATELAKLVQDGRLDKRRTLLDGKWTWVFWFVREE